MSTIISEAVYSADKRLPGFEQHVFTAAIQDLCRTNEALTLQMSLVLPILMKTAWKGTAPPNTESLFGDIKSVFLHIYDERKSAHQNGQVAQSALYEVLRMDDSRMRALLYEMHSTDVKFQKRAATSSPKEKVDPWKRRITMLNAAFAYWMVTHIYMDRYWALTRATYKPEHFTRDEIKQSRLLASVQFALQWGRSAEAITFLPLQKKPLTQSLRINNTGLLENTWD